MAEWAVVGIEAKVEYTEAALFSCADERVKVRLPADVQSHVAGRSRHLEFHVMTSHLWCLRQIEADVAEREAE